MKWRKILMIICLVFMANVPVTNIHAESMDGALVNQKATEKAEEDTEESTSDFISEAILSLDEETRKKEADEDYIKNFYNSSMTATTKGLNLFDGDSIIMCFLNLITLLFETIGYVVSFFVMTVYNLVSSSFLSNLIQSIFDTIDGILFDWQDPNSWINKVLLIACLSSILYKLIKDFTKLVRWQQIVQIILTAFISMSCIVFIGQHGRSIADALERSTNQMLSETFVFGEGYENIEITNKQNIFEILQKQPFMVRHYGTTDLEAIAHSNNAEDIRQAEKRVQKLLNDPSQENAEEEYEKYKNRNITHDSGSALQVLFLSFIMLIHRIAISIVIGGVCLAVGAIKAAKYIVLGLSVYQLIWWLFKRTRKARQWFIDRLAWCIATIFVDILFSAALFFLMELCTKIAAKSVLLMLAVDAILIVLLYFTIKNLPLIAEKLMEDGKVIAESMFLGGSSPMDAYRKLKNNDVTTSDATSTGFDADTSAAGNPYQDSDDLDDGALAERNDNYEDSYDDDSLRDEADTFDTFASDGENDIHQEQIQNEEREEEDNDPERIDENSDGQETSGSAVNDEEQVQEELQLDTEDEIDLNDPSFAEDENHDMAGDPEMRDELITDEEDSMQENKENSNMEDDVEQDDLLDDDEQEEDLSDEADFPIHEIREADDLSETETESDDSRIEIQEDEDAGSEVQENDVYDTTETQEENKNSIEDMQKEDEDVPTPQHTDLMEDNSTEKENEAAKEDTDLSAMEIEKEELPKWNNANEGTLSEDKTHEDASADNTSPAEERKDIKEEGLWDEDD